METPVNKLADCEQGRRPIVLVLNGSFNPIHLNHIRSLELVKKGLEEINPEIQIIGGYICITHDLNLKKKLASQDFCPGIDRLEMVRLAVADSNWIMADPWQCSQNRNPGAIKTKEHLLKIMQSRYPTCQAKWICGPDTLPLMVRTLKHDSVVVVVNRECPFDLDDFLESPAIKPNRDNIQVIYDPDKDRFIDFSSTKVRKLLRADENPSTFLSPAVFQYLLQRGICYKNKPDRTENACFVPPSKSHFEIDCETFNAETSIPNQCFSGSFKQLGVGRCGTVDAMVFGQNNEIFAVKSFHFAKRRSRKLRHFQREHSVFKILGKHPNVIPCFGYSLNEKSALLVLQLGVGTVQQHVKNKEFRPETPFPASKFWVRICQEMALGMSHLEQLALLHRDLTLDNVMLFPKHHGFQDFSDLSDSDLTAKIVDFSVSQWKSEQSSSIRGSCRHYSPEALRKDVPPLFYNCSDDVFMFGNLLYELAHGGAMIFGILRVEEAVKEVLAGRRPPVVASLHSEFAKWMEQCWEAPESRPTFSALAAGFSEMLSPQSVIQFLD